MKYSPFNLCLFEPRNNHGYEALYYCRGTERIQSEGPNALAFGASGFSNHPISAPYCKTVFGIRQFKSIVEQKVQVTEFEERAVNLLCNREERYPDDQMQKQSGVKLCDDNKEVDVDYELMRKKEQKLSSVFVDIGEIYGTRTQTMIFVDYNHNVRFTERTRVVVGPTSEMLGKTKDVTGLESFDFDWKIKSFEFKFNEGIDISLGYNKL